MTTAFGDVDETDGRILGLLQQNARRTFGDIGRAVGLSASAVKRRIDRLEALGVILGYTTLVDHTTSVNRSKRSRSCASPAAPGWTTSRT